MPTQIVQTITADTMDALRQQRDVVVDADIVELRLDGVADLDVAGALAGRTRPTIVTCRPVWEGGRYAGDEAVRRRLMAEAVAAGAEWVDIERRAGWVPDLRGTRTRLIVSDHDMHSVPSDLADRVRAMRALDADVVKVAVTATRVTDLFQLRAAVTTSRPGAGDLVCIAMGAAGQLSRLLPSRFGSCWTYGGDAAPGQVPARDLRHRYRVHTVTEATRVFGVAGAPLAHSASPAMHNAALQAAELDAVYVPLHATTAGEVLQVAEALGFEGVSLTAPVKTGWQHHPEVVFDDEWSRRLGVINTLRRNDAGWLGRNFDIAGFLDGCDAAGVTLAGSSALVLGSGGAARSAVAALSERGAIVEITARREEAAAHLAAELGVRAIAWPPRGAWDVVVNATPVGTWPAVDATPVDLAESDTRVVYDLVYNPETTTLLRQAAARGAQVIGGMDMLVGQAARQYEWWMGHKPDAQVMRAAAAQAIRELM
jgi:3-dehydroquinate dehydratase/shikimate dehydrogenase